MTSPQPTSSIEPSETTALNPTFSRTLQSRTAVRSAPLWLTKPTVPGAEIPAANVALRPDDPHPVGARRLQDLPLQLRPLGADLLEAGGDDHHGLDAGRGALVDGGRDGRGRRRDDDELGGFGQRSEVRVGPDAEDAGALLVDRVDGAPEWAADQVPEDGPAHAPHLFRGTDDGDAGRLEELVQRVAAVAQHVARAIADWHAAARGPIRRVEHGTFERGSGIGRLGH